MERIKVIALFGKSGSGKDTIQRELLKYLNNSQGIISNTTRPARDYEKDGVDYHFLTIDNFNNKEMIEKTEFNGWYYGTSIDSLDKDKINIGVFNPQGINTLVKNNKILVLPIYINASDKNRLIRQLNRENEPNCAEICRRFFTDEKDFQKEKYNFKYIIYNNNDKELNLEKIIQLVNWLPKLFNLFNTFFI